MNGYATSAAPPKRKTDVLWVEKINAGEKQQFVVYSPALWGVDTHWTNNRTVPCYENHSLCEGGHCEETLRWKGYLHVWSYKKNQPIFLQLTAGASRELLAQVLEGTTLRGLRLEVHRTQSAKGRLHANLMAWADRKQDNTMPPDLDPRRSLEHMWKVRPIEELLSAKLHVRAETIPDDPAELKRVS